MTDSNLPSKSLLIRTMSKKCLVDISVGLICLIVFLSLSQCRQNGSSSIISNPVVWTLKTLRLDAKFSRFQSKMFGFVFIEITTVGLSWCQRKVLSHVSIAGIFICLLFKVKDVNYFYVLNFLKKSCNTWPTGHVSQSTLSSLTGLVNVKNTGKLHLNMSFSLWLYIIQHICFVFTF
jgi:hypothetical protein